MDEAAIRQRVEAAGQAHVFERWDDLDLEQREALLAQLEALDFEGLARRVELIAVESDPPPPPAPLDPSEPDPAQRAEWAALGQEALAAGRVAVIVVAGGQGTRLGWSGPKGTYPVGPVSDKSLFQLFAEQLRALGQRAGREIPLYVMTSRLNRDQTADFFAEHGDFGLAAGQVRYLVQGDLPNVDLAGKLVFSAPGELATSPNGHGGTVLALHEGGALAAMREAGQDLLFYWQVDNPLCQIADPVFIGGHLALGAQASTKVVEKTDPGEKVGLLGLRDGRVTVLEYTEITPEQAAERNEAGQLRFRAGNIAVHLFDREFLAGVVEGDFALPYHLARKAVAILGPEGRLTQPDAPNVIKFETFIFDLLPLAETHLTLQVAREEEFEPLKNAEGPYSPATVKQALDARARRWLEQAGHAPPSGVTCEISPLVALSAADLSDLESLPAPGERGLHVELP